MHLTNVLIPTCVRGFDLDAERFDVDMQNGTVAQISRAQIAPDSVASGTLLPCLVDAHVHIDKTYVVDEVGAADGDLFKAITLMGQHRASWTTLDITMRMQRAVSDAYCHGLSSGARARLGNDPRDRAPHTRLSRGGAVRHVDDNQFDDCSAGFH